MLGLAEQLQPQGLVLALASALVIGRLLHGLYFTYHGMPWQMRMYGMLLTLIAQIGAILAVATGLV